MMSEDNLMVMAAILVIFHWWGLPWLYRWISGLVLSGLNDTKPTKDSGAR